MPFVVLKGVGSALDALRRLRPSGSTAMSTCWWPGADFDRAAAVVTALGGDRHSPIRSRGSSPGSARARPSTSTACGRSTCTAPSTSARSDWPPGATTCSSKPPALVHVGGRRCAGTGPGHRADRSVVPRGAADRRPRRLVPLRDVAELLRPVGSTRPGASRWRSSGRLRSCWPPRSRRRPGLFDLPDWGPLQALGSRVRADRAGSGGGCRATTTTVAAAYLLRTVDEVQALGSAARRRGVRVGVAPNGRRGRRAVAPPRRPGSRR